MGNWTSAEGLVLRFGSGVASKGLGVAARADRLQSRWAGDAVHEVRGVVDVVLVLLSPAAATAAL
jgi:hypothetical protein